MYDHRACQQTGANVEGEWSHSQHSVKFSRETGQEVIDDHLTLQVFQFLYIFTRKAKLLISLVTAEANFKL